MRKVLIFLVICLVTTSTVSARDYAKLQVKEMKHAQKYGTTNKYFSPNRQYNAPVTNLKLKDPGIMKFGEYKIISDADFNAKLEEDEKIYNEYYKPLKKITYLNYNAKAKGDDYYKLYRIAERMIRANKLDYINWRIAIYRDTEEPNAYSTNMNLVSISTSLYDTLKNNDDALALVIGHEMGHALLGHQQRLAQILAKMEKQKALMKAGNSYAILTYKGFERKYLIDSKNMEYAADVEGAKLAAKAGYSLDSASETLAFLNTLPHYRELYTDHPDQEKRFKNFNENRKYFIEDGWKQMGRYNFYNSEVLPVQLSSDRASVVISAKADINNSGQYYRPETMTELYTRLGYTSYKNGEFEKSLKYFNDLFAQDKNNASAYLYASYAAEQLGKKDLAKDYAKKAKEIEPENKYFNEQFDSL